MVHQYIDQNNFNYNNNNIHQYILNNQNNQNNLQYLNNNNIFYNSMDDMSKNICTNQDKKRKVKEIEEDLNNTIYINNTTADSIYHIAAPPKFLSFPSINLNILNNINTNHHSNTLNNNNNNNNNNNLILLPLDYTSNGIQSTDDNIMLPVEKKKDFNKRLQITSKEYKLIKPETEKNNFTEELKESLIEQGWRKRLIGEFSKDYFKSLMEFLDQEKESGVTILPDISRVFRCFNQTPFDQVKVVFLGSEPPSGANQANGLSFSIQDGSVKQLPPYLKNIFQELHNDLGVCKDVSNGDLEKWAQQGVLLLNSTLTVRKTLSESHSNKGWEQFTDTALRILSKERKGIIFLLWGTIAQDKSSLIDKDNNHHILKAPHPSQFSAHKGFFGCKHFSQVNNILNSNGQSSIDWELKK